MALNSGTRLGPYEIRTPLGAGGMGEVYKAIDTRLDRTVAIKVLPAHVASDPELRQRFEREARTISSLNHPHICTLHDVGHQDDLHYLVMEYVEGETLAARLQRGPLPVDQALVYAIEIADALNKAHRQGITHRDLKPANIMLTKAGTKLLDFGLAKPAARTGALDVTRPPTLSPSPTAQGTILGTLQYMSPEQLEGGQADARSDIFAFGAVLFEMVTGRKAFEGKSQASVIAAILEREPPAVSSQQPLVPPMLDRIVAKCLIKDPDARWQSAHDLAEELTWIRQGIRPDAAVSAPVPAVRPIALRTMIGAAIAAALAVIIAAGITWSLASGRRPVTDARIIRFLVDTPAVSLSSAQSSVVRTTTQGIGLPSLDVSADGRRLVYVARTDALPLLYVRNLEETVARALAGTEGAEGPFFAPDGERVGFFAGGQLKTVSLRGGAPIALAAAGSPRGGTWSSDGYIYFSRSTEGGISRIATSGGDVEIVSRLEGNVRTHRWPHALPGGEAILVTVSEATDTTFDQSRIVVLRPATGEMRPLITGGSFGRYAQSGHVLYRQAGALLAAPFDLDSVSLTGAATTVLSGLVTDPITGAAHVAVAGDGMLAYVAGDMLSYDRTLVWVDRSGKEEPLPVDARPYQGVRLSPDGQRAAVDIDGATANIWIVDIARGSLTRLTLGWSNNYPNWSPEGDVMFFFSGRGGVGNVYRQAVDGRGAAEAVLPAGSVSRRIGGVAPDGSLIYNESSPDTANDIWLLEPSREATPFIRGPFEELWPQFSPDGAWVAYVSNESGRDEVYVQPRTAGGKVQVSVGGGTMPRWSRNGREIYYRQGLAVAAVPILSSTPFSVGRPVRLFDGPYAPLYDVAPDGRFLMIREIDRTLPSAITVVTNWFTELNRLAPR